MCVTLAVLFGTAGFWRYGGAGESAATLPTAGDGRGAVLVAARGVDAQAGVSSRTAPAKTFRFDAMGHLVFSPATVWKQRRRKVTQELQLFPAVKSSRWELFPVAASYVIKGSHQ